MTRLLILVIALSCCSKSDHDKGDKLAKLCDQGSKLLADGPNADDFISVLSSTVEACSQACDINGGSACHKLGDHLAITCKAMPSFCDQMCKDATSTSLRTQACELSKHKL
jgi:hypothetical protein